MKLFTTPLNERLAAPILIIVLCWATFWPTLTAGFMIDDPFLLRAINENPGLTVESIRHDFTGTVHRESETYYYRPLLSLLTRIEYAVWGNKALGYHAVSLLFHTANSILVFALFQLVGFSPIISGITSVFFAVHPALIDDLLAATGGESMAIFFLLGTLVLFLKNRPLAGTLLAFPAMFAKESNIVLPVLLGILFFYQKRPRASFRPVFLTIVPVAVFLIFRAAAVSMPPHVSIGTCFQFLLVAFPRIVFHYLGVTLAPVHLEAWPPIFPLSPYYPLIFVLFVGCLAVALFPKGNRRLAFLCVSWFLVNLAPRIPAMMATNIIMDKWVSLASLGIFLPIAFGLERFGRRSDSTRLIAGTIVVSILTFWIAVAHINAQRRGSDEKNYRWTIRNGPRGFANFRLGLILMHSGRFEEALKILSPFNEIYLDHPDFQNALILARWHNGERETALEAMAALAKKFPDNGSISRNLEWMRKKP